MSEYKNIEVDFVERTLKLLEKVDKQRYAQYKTTHLVNLCMGLIVFPNEHDEKLKLMFQDKSAEYLRLTDENIIMIKGNDKRANIIIRHLRNSIAHGRIEQIVKHHQICKLKFTDCNINSDEIHTEIILSVNQLKYIAVLYANEYIKMQNQQ